MVEDLSRRGIPFSHPSTCILGMGDSVKDDAFVDINTLSDFSSSCGTVQVTVAPHHSPVSKPMPLKQAVPKFRQKMSSLNVLINWIRPSSTPEPSVHLSRGIPRMFC